MYKYSLCAIFFNIISFRHRTKNQEKNFEIIETIKTLHLKDEEAKSYFNLFIKNKVEDSFAEIGTNGTLDSEKINKIIAFMREKTKILIDEKICLFQAKELNDIININKFLGVDFLTEFYWIEFNLSTGLVLTVPEMIIYNDFKITWNNLIETKNYIDNAMQDKITNENIVEYYKDNNNRTMNYKLGAYYRNLIFLSVSFVESYLYNLFYSIKKSSINEKNKSKWNFNNNGINDTQILEDVLFPMYEDIKVNISNEYKNYKKLIHLRDRYVHAIPTIDESNNRSNLKPLLNIDLELIVELLQSSITMVITIQNMLPKEFKILYWWDDNNINFSKFEPIPLTKSNSRFNYIEYSDKSEKSMYIKI